MTLFDRMNDSLELLAIKVSAGENYQCYDGPDGEKSYEDLVSLCVFFVWSEFRNLRDDLSCFGKKSILSYFLKRGYNAVESEFFIDSQIDRWKKEARGKSPRNHWAIGPTIEWLNQHGYSNSRDVEAWYSRCEIMEENSDIFIGNSTVLFDWPIAKCHRQVKELVEQWRSHEKSRVAVPPLELRMIAKDIARDLVTPEEKLQDELDNTAFSQMSERTPTNILTVENIAKAKACLLSSQQKKPYLTAFEFVERMAITHSNQSLSRSKLSSLFYKYFTTPLGNELTECRMIGATSGIQVSEKGRHATRNRFTEIVQDDRALLENSTYRICRIAGSGGCVKLSTEPIENLALEFAIIDSYDSVQNSGFELCLSICPSGHGWSGRKRCPICGALPKKKNQEFHFAIAKPEALKQGRRWASILLDPQFLKVS